MRAPRGASTKFALLAGLALALIAPLAVMAATPQATKQDCMPKQKNTKCYPGQGKQSPGGHGSTSHKGWPKFYGIIWQVIVDSDKGESRTGTQYSDELLGRNGSDHIAGGASADVLWGDASATVNGSAQHDVISGGSGSDYIYASHGSNTISGDSGNDHITGTFGHGTIDCGSGRDTVTVRKGSHAYVLKNCEKVVHP